MMAIKLRQLIVFVATGLFFVVAALSEVDGASLAQTLLKSAVSCVILVLLGLGLVRIVEEGERKGAKRPGGSAALAGQMTTGTAEGAEQVSKNAG